MAREVSFPFFMFIWGYKLLAYTKSHCWHIQKSPEKAKASLFWNAFTPSGLIRYSSFVSSEVKGVKEVITPYGRSGS